MDELLRQSARLLGIESFKEKQVEAITSFVSGKDTFVSLPTGYGKSLIYASLPYIFDQKKVCFSTLFGLHCYNAPSCRKIR